MAVFGVDPNWGAFLKTNGSNALSNNAVANTTATYCAGMGPPSSALVGTTSNLTGFQIMEVIHYNVGLSQSATAFTTLEGYLAWKWGLTGSLPVGHPYKSTAPVPGTWVI